MEQPPTSYHNLIVEALNCLDYKLVHNELTFEKYMVAKNFIELFLADGDYYLGDKLFIILQDLKEVIK